MIEYLPPRYQIPLREGFDREITARLVPGISVLDIGSGRHPAIPPEHRPADVEYVGLDLSADELRAAGEGAYTATVAADATLFQPDLAGQFNLVISWQVLEHVRDLEATVSAIRRYLRPRGRFVAQFSGAWSAFGVINRLLPDRIGAKLVDRAMKRTEQNIPVFPAYYDRCSARSLDRLFSSWSRYELTPIYFGAAYFDFFPPLRRIYLTYEDWIERSNRRDLATHYLLSADC